MNFDYDACRLRVQQAKSGEELRRLVLELPERSNIEVALERGYTGQEAQDYAEMLDLTNRTDSAKLLQERFCLVEQMPERIRQLWANFHHPT